MIGTSMCWGYIAPTADAAHGLIAFPYVVGDDLYVFGGAATAGVTVTVTLAAVAAANVPSPL